MGADEGVAASSESVYSIDMFVSVSQVPVRNPGKHHNDQWRDFAFIQISAYVGRKHPRI